MSARLTVVRSLEIRQTSLQPDSCLIWVVGDLGVLYGASKRVQLRDWAA